MDILTVVLALLAAFLGTWLGSERRKVKRLQCPVFVVFLHETSDSVIDGKSVHVQQVLQYSGKNVERALATARERLTRDGFSPASGCFLKYVCSNRAVWAEIIVGTGTDNERSVLISLALAREADESA